ncbi:hypothetical protein T07_2267, partial [Trichinella nelsoni]
LQAAVDAQAGHEFPNPADPLYLALVHVLDRHVRADVGGRTDPFAGPKADGAGAGDVVVDKLGINEIDRMQFAAERDPKLPKVQIGASNTFEHFEQGLENSNATTSASAEHLQAAVEAGTQKSANLFGQFDQTADFVVVGSDVEKVARLVVDPQHVQIAQLAADHNGRTVGTGADHPHAAGELVVLARYFHRQPCRPVVPLVDQKSRP